MLKVNTPQAVHRWALVCWHGAQHLALALLLCLLATGTARATQADWPAYWQTRFAPGSAERSLLDQAFADYSAGELKAPLAAQAESLLRPRLERDSAAAAAANPSEPTLGLALARAWMFLGELASARGDDAQCAQDEQQGLVWFERSIGVEAGEYGQSLSSHANTWGNLQQHDKAIELDTRALTIVEKAFGKRHRDTVIVIDSLASKLYKRGQYRSALPLYARSLTNREEVHGPDHTSVALGLNNLARVHHAMGEYALALPLFERALAIIELAKEDDDSLTGTLLGGIAGLHRDMGQYALALPLFERALSIVERSQGPHHASTGTVINNLAGVHHAMGQYTLALPLFERALSIIERSQGPYHASTGTVINNLAGVYHAMGQHTLALPLFERALSIIERSQGPYHPSTGRHLSDVAKLYMDMNQYIAAIPLFERALTIREKTLGLDHPSTGESVNNLAVLHHKMTQYALALPLYQRALTISERSNGPEHPVTATSINNLASVLGALGQYAVALPLFERAVAISEKSLGPSHPTTGMRINNLALLHQTMGRYAIALPLYERALSVSVKANGADHPNTGKILNNLALLHQDTGEYVLALLNFERALAIFEKSLGPNHFVTCGSISNLASLHYKLRDYAQAFQLLDRAVSPAECNNQSEILWTAHTSFMIGLSNASTKDYNPALAIWYGKQAVNTLQTVRGGLRGLNQEAQQSFLKKNEHTYTYLANLLIEAGRLAEAEQVLDILKEYELFQLLRSRSNGAAVPQLSFGGLEQQALAQRQQLAAQGVKLSVELDALRKKQGPSADELRRMDELEAASAAWRGDYERFLAALGQRFAAEGRKGAEQLSDQQRTRLQDNVAKDAAGSVGLHYSVSDEGVGIIVATPTASFGRFSAIKREVLDQQVAALRQAILKRADTRPAAQALWRMLIAPVLADLQASGAKTVVLSLTDTLRYLPFAALQNPEGRYLVQDFALSGWANAGRDVEAPATGAGAPRWHVAGLGVSKAHTGFEALPAVRGELQSIVRTTGSPGGLLPGQIALDEAFGLPEFNAALRGPANVLHVASHFTFLPGNDLSSGLLLGSGERLSLTELRGKDFSRLDQLTLSACDTAMGGGVNQNGAEVEGLASIVLKEGKARSVMATLWKVADDSTAQLMRQFYTLRSQTQPMSRAQALRRAQLSLLEGQTSGPTNAGNTERAAASTVNRAASAGNVPAEPNKPYAHPYFWAPFTLSGNWM
jgi:CHAT domain-containing protein